jgi:hypothetical protein
MQSQDSDLVAQLKRDWRSAKLSEANRSMLEYAEKLTVKPSAMTKTDLDGLRQHFSEEQAFDIVIIACLFNFMDRLVLCPINNFTGAGVSVKMWSEVERDGPAEYSVGDQRI